MNNRALNHVRIGAIMALLGVLISYPVLLHIQDFVAGQGGDPWQTMWRLTSKYSGGYQEFVQDITGSGEARIANLSIWPWVGLHYFFGEPIAYNIIWLASLILSGYAMALCIKILTNQKSIYSTAPLLAGIAYMLLPYRSAHALGHFGAMQLQWIPFICAAALVYIRKPTVWKIALVGVLFSVQAWTEHHYALWLVIFAIIAAIVYRTPLRQDFAGRRRVNAIHGLLLAIILIFGVILPYIPTVKLAAIKSDAIELGVQQTIRFSADLFSFITPSPQHPLWGDFFDSLFGGSFTGNNAENVQYLGIAILVAILFFHRHIPVRQKRLWTITIIIFLIISLGPVLHVFGKNSGILLPYALIANLPLFAAIRVVARAGVMVGFAVCVLFGWTLATNIHRPRTALIAGIVIILDFMFLPFPMQSAILSPAYDELVALSGSRIIEVPAATNYTAASRSLYASTLHGKETLGNIALERGQSQDAYELAKQLPGIRQLLYLRTTELLEERLEFFEQNIQETLPDAMKYIDAYAVLVHTDSVTATQHQAIALLLDAIPDSTKKSFGDAELYIFGAKSVSKSDGVFLIRNYGFENIGYDAKRQSTFAEIPTEASLTIVNMNSFPVRVELLYVIAPESTGELVSEKVFEVKMGTQEVKFVHYGDGKSIIQNPSFRVVPFDAAQGKSLDL